MDKLIGLLKANGIELSESKLWQAVQEAGFDPDKLDDGQVGEVFKAILAKQSGLAKGKQSGLGEGKQRRGSGRKQQTPPNISDSVTGAAGQADQEMGAAIAPIVEAIDGWTSYKAGEVAEVVKNAPVVFLEKLGTELEGHRADPEAFRQLGKEFAQRIFNFIPDSEADTVA